MRLRERVVAALHSLVTGLLNCLHLLFHRTPKFFPEVELGIAVGYEFPKSEIPTHHFETATFLVFYPGGSGLFSEACIYPKG